MLVACFWKQKMKHGAESSELQAMWGGKGGGRGPQKEWLPLTGDLSEQGAQAHLPPSFAATGQGGNRVRGRSDTSCPWGD